MRSWARVTAGHAAGRVFDGPGTAEAGPDGSPAGSSRAGNDDLPPDESGDSRPQPTPGSTDNHPQVVEARTPRGRMESLDGIRLLAALCVVLFHYNGTFLLGIQNIVPAVERLYLFVDVFFVLSGFVIAESYRGRMTDAHAYGAFLARRIGRIYPLHLVTLVATVALGGIFVATGLWPSLPPHMNPSAIPGHVALTQGIGVFDKLYYNYPSWSISAEMAQYVLFPIYVVLARRISTWLSVGLFAAVMVLISVLYMDLGKWSGFTADGALRAVPGFYAGVAISVALQRYPNLALARWTAVYGLGVVLLAALCIGLADHWIIGFSPLLILAAVCAERGGARTWLASRWMVILGEASFGIYMLHIPIAMAVAEFGRPVLGHGLASSILLCGFAFGSCLWLSVQSFRRFERPAQRWIARLYGKTGRVSPRVPRSVPA